MKVNLKSVVLYVLVIASPLLGNVRIVPSGSPGQAIQDSINVCEPHDTVMVEDGRYFVNSVNADTGLIMRDSICLMSENGAVACTLDAAGAAYHVIYCAFGDSSSHEAMIQGFTIQDGRCNQENLVFYCGGGILCYCYTDTHWSRICPNQNKKRGINHAYVQAVEIVLGLPPFDELRAGAMLAITRR